MNDHVRTARQALSRLQGRGASALTRVCDAPCLAPTTLARHDGASTSCPGLSGHDDIVFGSTFSKKCYSERAFFAHSEKELNVSIFLRARASLMARLVALF